MNICRHRAHPVVIEDGQPAARCSATTTGGPTTSTARCCAAPRPNGEPGFDVADVGLVPVQVARVGPDGVGQPVDLDAPSFDEWTDGHDRAAASSAGCDVDVPRAGDRATRGRSTANWKVFQDNTIECYHCPTTHPEFAGPS